MAGLSLCQDYLAQVRDGSIACRPEIAAVEGTTVMFADGTSETVEAIVCATGYDLDLPYLPRTSRPCSAPVRSSTSAPSTPTSPASA